MPMPLSVQPVAPGARQLPVSGISEWQCWYSHFKTDYEAVDIERVVEDCIDVHLDVGIDQLVWNCGRSRLDYHSDLPDVTLDGEGVDASDGSWASFRAKVMEAGCPLRRALTYCRDRNVPLLGRLAMNRHYSLQGHPDLVSKFAAKHEEYQERHKGGGAVSHKLCYAIEEVRRERLEILLEIQRIGVDALVLDFCRQVPILMYHPALVEPFRQDLGVDPREIDSDDPEDYREWFQYRADVLTGFMRDLREGVRRQEEELGRPCPIVARVPDNRDWIMPAFGIDLEQWFREDIVDATMLSPFPLVLEDMDRHPEWHVELSHRYAKACFGGVGSLNLFRNEGKAVEALRPEEFYDPQTVYALADRQFRAGVDAMSVYQSETLARLSYLQGLIRDLGQPEIVARKAKELPKPGFSDKHVQAIGVDWHSVTALEEGGWSKTPHSLRAETSSRGKAL